MVAEGAFSTRELLKRYVKLKAPRYVGLPWVWRHFPDPLFGFITDLSLGAMRLLLRRRYLSVKRAVGATNARPCFFIHAEKDFIVSLALAKQLYTKASQPKSLWVIPGAQHAEGFHAAPDVYGTRVVNFFREHLN